MNRSNPDRRRRGVSLVVMLVLMPAALLLYLGLLNRADVALMTAERDYQRVQSRALAESALTVAQEAPGAARSGELGPGRGWSIEPLEGGRLACIGRSAGPRAATYCTLTVEPDPAGGLRLLAIAWGAEPAPPRT